MNITLSRGEVADHHSGSIFFRRLRSPQIQPRGLDRGEDAVRATAPHDDCRRLSSAEKFNQNFFLSVRLFSSALRSWGEQQHKPADNWLVMAAQQLSAPLWERARSRDFFTNKEN
jgi:hypothetical protein